MLMYHISSKYFTVAPGLINLIDLTYNSDLSNHFILVYLIIRVCTTCAFRDITIWVIHKHNISLDFHSKSNRRYIQIIFVPSL